jgi:GT2 family glycosyltransferase
MTARVHVGIVTYNSLTDLPRCLNSLKAQTYPDIHLVILDNTSADGTVAWLQAHAPLVSLLINDQNVGFARAHNQIIAHCGPEPDEYYLPLNPDVELDPNYIASLVTLLQQTGGGWAIGKLRLLDSDGLLYSVGHGLRRGGYTFNIGYRLPDEGQFDTVREVFGAPGAAPLFSGKLIADIAPQGEVFDADMFMYGEDTDLDWRARRLGWKCWYSPAAAAYHRGSHAQDIRRSEALANRYLSVIKNAYLVDFFAYNLPLMAAHCAVRLLLTPRQGILIVKRLLRVGPVMWHKRRKPTLAHKDMVVWFRWSARQPTGQPMSWKMRLKTFLNLKRLR